MISQVDTPRPAPWRRRAGVGAAASVALVAIAGGVGAGLETSPRWTNSAHAAVIPDVLFLEGEVAKVASIARVNAAIAREVTVDVQVDELARRAGAANATAGGAAPSRGGSGADSGDLEGGSGNDGSNDAAEATTGERRDSGGSLPGGNSGSTGPSNANEDDKAGGTGSGDNAPGGDRGPAGDGAGDGAGGAPVPPIEPVPSEPDTTDPSKGIGTPPVDRGKPVEKGPKATVDAKSGAVATPKEEAP